MGDVQKPLAVLFWGALLQVGRFGAIIFAIGHQEHPGDVEAYSLVIDTRQSINNMTSGSDDRLLVVIGPESPDGEGVPAVALLVAIGVLAS